MPPLVLTLDGAAVRDIASFYDEVNRVFMADEDWQLGQSLDALDDLLYGGYGALAGHEAAMIVWAHSARSRAALGRDATRAWLLGKLAQPGTYNSAALTRQLQALDQGHGQSYFDIVLDVFAGHAHLQLVLA